MRFVPRGGTLHGPSRGGLPTAATAAAVALLAVAAAAACLTAVAWFGGGPPFAACPVPRCPACPNGNTVAGDAHSGPASPLPALPSGHAQQQPSMLPTGSGDIHAPMGTDADADGTDGTADATPLLCGGPSSVPSVPAALAAATAALLRGPEEDLAPWADSGFSLADIQATAAALGANGSHDTKLWVEVRNKTIIFPLRPGQECSINCNPAVAVQVEALNRGMQAGWLTLPEGLPFLWNVRDYAGCPPSVDNASRVCRAPLLSVIRPTDHTDAMMPIFTPPFDPQFVPWQEKKDIAFFRGTPYCNYHPLEVGIPGRAHNCSRIQLALLSEDHPDLLNSTLTDDRYKEVKPSVGPPTSHEEQAHYKYLLNLDGNSASRRLATLLGMNSLVLKQHSLHQEWYYRALLPCVHYLPFWLRSEADVLPLLRVLASPANQAVAQRIAANGQAFAMAHLTDEARWRYWQRLADKYVALYRGGSSGTADATATSTAAAADGGPREGPREAALADAGG